MAKQPVWEQRVAERRSSGQTAEEFAAARDFAASTLTWWARRLAKERGSSDVRIARVIRGGAGTPVGPRGVATAGNILIEVGASRVRVPDGADPTTLRIVLAMLGAPGRPT